MLAKGLPSLATRVGLVVIPSTTPISTPCRISSRFAVSRKIFMIGSLSWMSAEYLLRRTGAKQSLARREPSAPLEDLHQGSATSTDVRWTGFRCRPDPRRYMVKVDAAGLHGLVAIGGSGQDFRDSRAGREYRQLAAIDDVTGQIGFGIDAPGEFDVRRHALAAGVSTPTRDCGAAGGKISLASTMMRLESSDSTGRRRRKLRCARCRDRRCRRRKPCRDTPRASLATPALAPPRAARRRVAARALEHGDQIRRSRIWWRRDGERGGDWGAARRRCPRGRRGRRRASRGCTRRLRRRRRHGHLDAIDAEGGRGGKRGAGTGATRRRPVENDGRLGDRSAQIAYSGGQADRRAARDPRKAPKSLPLRRVVRTWKISCSPGEDETSAAVERNLELEAAGDYIIFGHVAGDGVYQVKAWFLGSAAPGINVPR